MQYESGKKNDANKVEVKLSVTIRRKVVDGEIELGIERTVHIQGKAERDAEYDKLYRAVDDQFKDFVARYALEFDKVNPPSERGASGANDGAWVDCEVLSIDVKNGKRYFYIKGGQYTKHGVVVWKEVIEPSGILDNMPIDQYSKELKGWEMFVVPHGTGVKVGALRPKA